VSATAPATSSRSPSFTGTFVAFPSATRITVGGSLVVSTADRGAASAATDDAATRPWA